MRVRNNLMALRPDLIINLDHVVYVKKPQYTTQIEIALDNQEALWVEDRDSKLWDDFMELGIT